MLNRKQIELIHQEMDGVNTPHEHAEFRALIEQDAEARAFAAELRNVTGLLDGVESVDPPRHMTEAILHALPRHVETRSSWEALGAHVKTIFEGFRLRPRFALVSAMCVGVVIGFAGYAALAGTVLIDRSDAGNLAGALFESGATDAWETAHDVPIDVNGVSGRVVVRTARSIVFVELELNVEQTLEIRLTFDERAYGWRGFSQLSSETGTYVTAEPGLVRVTASGTNTHTLALNRRGPVSPLALSLIENDREVFATTLFTPEADQGG